MDQDEVEMIPKCEDSSPKQSSRGNVRGRGRGNGREDRPRRTPFPFKRVESDGDSSWFDIFGFGSRNVLNRNLTYGLALALPQCDCKRLTSSPITFNIEQAVRDNPKYKALPKKVKGERCSRFNQWWLKCCQSAVLKQQGIYWNVIQLLTGRVRVDGEDTLVSELVLGKRITLAIDLDIKRTYPSLRFFNRYGRSMLRRILLAYAFFDPEVGYVQGLNFIVANLLWHSSEEQAFWALISMMYLYDLRCMFLPGLPGVFKRCEILEHCMVRHIPRLHDHLKSVGVHIPMIASDWFMTLCANSVPIKALGRLWDSFFSEGWVAIFRFVIFRLRQFEEYLVTMSDIADIMKVIKYGNVSLTEGWNLMELIPGFGGANRRKVQLINAAYSNNVDNLTNDPNKASNDFDWVAIVEESLEFEIETEFIDNLELTNSEIMYFDIPPDALNAPLYGNFGDGLERPEEGSADDSDALKSCLSSQDLELIEDELESNNSSTTPSTITASNRAGVNSAAIGTTTTTISTTKGTTTGNGSGTDAIGGCGGTTNSSPITGRNSASYSSQLGEQTASSLTNRKDPAVRDLFAENEAMRTLRDHELGDVADRLEQLALSFRTQLDAIGVSKAYHLHLKALHDFNST